MKSATNHWLVKSEPLSYGIDHLKKDKETWWTGVRNYQSRNFMKAMKKGDLVLFYHSNCDEPGIYGLARVSEEARPDETQFDKKSPYYEPRATKANPVWECAKLRFVEKLKRPILIGELRLDPKLSTMQMLRRGSRLSVTPVSKEEFERVEKLRK